MKFLEHPRKPLDLHKIGSLPATVHVFEQRDVDAVNAALASARPLLVRGEPGSGKSQLARAAAQGLGRAFVATVVDARTEARDLQWSFDAVRRLADAQVIGATGLGPGETVQSRLAEPRYVIPGPLWWAFDRTGAEKQAAQGGGQPPEIPEGCFSANGTVLLLDEIDKADSSVPNGLLECLGHGRFPGPGGLPVEVQGIGPLVVVTTNEERTLPDAFLRRCLVLQLRVPSDRQALIEWLMARGRAHFAQFLADSVLAKAASQLADDRSEIVQRGLAPPGGAEYLDLLAAVSRLGQDTASQEQLLDRIGEFALRKHPIKEHW